MSISDSDSSSNGDYRNFRQVTRDRLLYEMLRSTREKETKTSWKVLIMDKLTVKVMSYACKMSDITEEGVSLVEDINKRRQPMPLMDAIYFLQPTKENVVMFLSDMSGRSPLYKRAFVFFSSPISRELVNQIKNSGTVFPRIGALVEMNLEYFAIDSQGFLTDHERALEDLFGDNAEILQANDAYIYTMAARIATVFASLREFPYVRFRAAKSSLDASTMITYNDLIPTKLAAAVWHYLARYKATIPDFPKIETCELLIVDRSVDLIAPIIHEWTYDAMCHDLLSMDGNKYVQEVPNKTGSISERKEVLLEDHDPIWLELRHSHIADASERLHLKTISFISRNKAAQIHHSSRFVGELSTKDLQKMVQALPQYSEQIDKLSLHVEIAGKINKVIRDLGLKELGQLEQALVFGDVGTKELINFLRTKQDVNPENKLRLLWIYAALYPEKFESEKGEKLMELARLSSDDTTAIYNMRYLRLPERKKISRGFPLKFDVHKKRHAARKERNDEQESWQLARFYPIIVDLIEKLTMGCLPENEYHCMNYPSSSVYGTPIRTPHRLSVRTAHGENPSSSIYGTPIRTPHRLSIRTAHGENPSSSVYGTPIRTPPRLSVRTAHGENPSSSVYGTPNRTPPRLSVRTAHGENPQSVRSKLTATWARPRSTDDAYSSDPILGHASGDLRKMGQRIFVFIIGGATRSELRAAHKLSSKLKREIILGSTSLDDPGQFIMKLKKLSTEDISLDDLQI